MAKATKKKPKTISKDKSSVLIRDNETQAMIVGSLKRCFSRSPIVREFLHKYRREEIWFKKDGTQAKKPRVLYKCWHCHKEFNSNQIQVDHIIPVVPVNIPAKHLSYNILVNRLFCDESNLQILCKEHHKDKSQQENAVRQEWMLKIKYIIYETVNKINNKKYIGIHKCEDYDDGYLGSGTAFQSALAKYGKQHFYRHIVDVFDNIDDAVNKERELVNAEIVESEDYYNLALGGNYTHIAGNKNKIQTICHETKEVFDSITDAADAVSISISSIVKVLDNPTQVARNLHFFTYESYDPTVTVSYPNIGKRVIHLNTRKTYNSIIAAAADTGLNYKSLRNAFVEQTIDGVYALQDQYFLYEEEFDPSKQYIIKHRKIRCIELNQLFNTALEATALIKHNKPLFAAILINRAIREDKKAYGYTWDMVSEELVL